ncbi:hypothetical protein PSHT_10982 [Puccinia striiformis]|uniref:Uncharacterized protein n=1 Tax=Puccinia striiformis TaxID=27350 RepID=A0A2S4V6F7_9BASI|nr:hypothetical protein PSHT_10982 [Puccinia striiformis]
MSGGRRSASEAPEFEAESANRISTTATKACDLSCPTRVGVEQSMEEHLDNNPHTRSSRPGWIRFKAQDRRRAVFNFLLLPNGGRFKMHHVKSIGMFARGLRELAGSMKEMDTTPDG